MTRFKYITTVRLITGLIILLIFSCENREWDNPFDPDCPKELFTPANFTAKQEGTLVKLTWSQSNTQISGFVIERSVDGGATWSSIATPSKTELTWNDNNITGGKEHKYRLTAQAGSNSSNQVSTQLTLAFVMNIPGTTVTDIEGNTYKSVKIGTQTWMAENLKTKKYRDGTSIPNITDGTTWAGLTTGAYCYFGNSTTNGAVYGGLYNFFAVVDNRKLCPTGWHIPSDSEWMTLRDYLGGENVAGGKLKETGIVQWDDPNVGADNSSGFTALGGSWRGTSGPFYYHTGYTTYFWSSSVDDSGNPVFYELAYNSSNFVRRVGNVYFLKSAGLSIRCLKD